ncbi:unnamed protein product [Boreogadus saida]
MPLFIRMDALPQTEPAPASIMPFKCASQKHPDRQDEGGLTGCRSEERRSPRRRTAVTAEGETAQNEAEVL